MKERKMIIRTCPFCGGEASVGRSASKFLVYVFVECDVCGCKSRAFTDVNMETFNTDEYENTKAGERAIRLWNKRAGDEYGEEG